MAATLSDKIRAAHARRAARLPACTDAFRLVDGHADDLGGLTVDAFAGRWLVGYRLGVPLPQLPADLGYRSLYQTLHTADEGGSGPQWVAGERVEAPFWVEEGGVRLSVDFGAGLSQGIFLDQRDNRAELRARAKGRAVLNLFAYTCAFGLVGALGGGTSVNIDLSRRYLDWGRRNYRGNGLDDGGHDFLHGDAFAWLARFRRRERRFDVVVLDPPTFSRNRAGRIFRAEHDYGELVSAACAVLAPGGTLRCGTNTHRRSADGFRAALQPALPAHARLTARPLPFDFAGSGHLKTFWVDL